MTWVRSRHRMAGERFSKRSGILCALTLPGDDPHLSRDQATAIFRIFQEILTNVARHAQATKVWVHLGEEQEAIVLEVEDNGGGNFAHAVGGAPLPGVARCGCVSGLGRLAVRSKSSGRKIKAPP
jgi:signal transduction histidine kinase